MAGFKWKQLELDFFFKKKTGIPFPDLDERATHAMRIAGHLTFRLPEPVDLVFTDNRSTMLSYRRRGGRLVLRLHRMFRHADEDVVEALARYLQGRDEKASAVIDGFIEKHKNEIREARRSAQKGPEHLGKHHDLTSILTRVNEHYFDNTADVRIGWGRSSSRKNRRGRRTVSRTLATYSYDDRAIRINPVLDSREVPGYVLEWIVYHELLHHVLPVEETGGRRRYHSRRFKVLERAFSRYDEVRDWENRNIERILSSKK